MLLSDLPQEIILVITDHLDDAGVNALARTHSQMYNLLNEQLYLRDMINPYEIRSLAWAVSCATYVEDVTTKKNTVHWALYAVRHLKPMPAHLHYTINIALGHAAAKGYAYLVERFLEVDGINPNFGEEDPPLVSAAEVGNSAVVELLLAAVNIDLNARYGRGDVNLNTAGFGGQLTPLAAACLNNYPEIIHLLLSKEGIDVNCRGDFNGETALFIAVSTDWVLLETIKLLLEREDIDINIPDNAGQTPLHMAITNRITERKISIVSLLLGKKGIDPNVRDNEDYTPLAKACGGFLGYLFRDTITIVRLLLSHCNTDPNPVDNNGISALTKVICNSWFGHDQKTREEIKSLLYAANYNRRILGRTEELAMK
ncbi:Ankyrin repeat-containing domain protein [Elaphomyces granulatus]